ncbi:uncharacterized protein MONBRDRAFT_29533 [Monosiga brevicollis MX1]|uniref:NADP-dependent oxidoreductase domain-containing protein n=1 Tax=Monosiga brevicollis TaxID=81824 RepID=A9VBD1_MONBE|nr:uncharacterized protein MONBRDRAFT_29533 [Monosiga brevicollis MX1]EDQ85216.1 predicted protein [Monosiga brevicollis MX1]|eukprot:XP_001750041.1 hypothetical protein [Monosiga brevicollis MX1]
MPVIGLGTWKSPLGKTGAAVKVALESGYRCLDTANDYANEAEIGEALQDVFAKGDLKRSDIFIQSKLWNSNHRPEHVRADLEATLRDLQTDYVDSFVIHWPQVCTMFPIEADGKYSSDNESHYVDTWHAMEELVDAGLVRTIGLSNFNRRQVAEVQAAARKYQPTILQNECHPYLQNKDLIDFCQRTGVQFQSYSPLGSYDRPWAQPGEPELLEDPRLKEIGARHGNKTTAQVVLRWHIQRGTAACPKSVTPARIESNFQVFDFELTPEDMAVLSDMNMGWRHLLWDATAMHPDYPFKDDLPHDHVVPDAPMNTSHSSRN